MTTAYAMSPADVAAHQAASYVRPLQKRVPGEALKAEQIEIAYQERNQQLAQQVAYELTGVAS